jgi:hypothetical protein
MALVALLETLDQRVRGVESLTALINMRPLVIIPYISTQGEIKRRKYLTRYFFLAMLILIILVLLLIHFLIMPLDLVIVKLMARFA